MGLIIITRHAVTYIDENDFNKKFRSLRKYCPKAHKYLIFEILNKHKFDFNDGVHELELPTSKEFKSVYGQIELIYSTADSTIILEDIKPSNFLLAGHKKDLDVYKGMPYRNSKDKFKINLIMTMKGTN